ncbi:basic leucine zipper 43-like [Rutidosis leptorrhynchoides]|uniref:basic leucine zipper 43-like n=1 Tax=Rutidosis leptorrhynchoides TaxID=125765 RepID=UPI003A99A2BA
MAENYYYEHPSCNISTNFTSFQNDVELFTNLPYYQQPSSNPQMPMYNLYQQSSPLSYNNSSTSDEADENQISIINDRKKRRMISNRESARRSRMRKQKQLDELCTYVMQLRNENHGLIDKMNRFLETREQVIQENDKLKKETNELRQLLSEAQLATTYTNLRDLEDVYEVVLVPSCRAGNLSN